jgi:hypothetical protein
MRWRQIALGCVLAACSVLTAVDARAQAYRWTDEHGQVHFTDDPSDIPPRFRKQLEAIPLPEPAPPAPPADVSWLDMLLGGDSAPAHPRAEASPLADGLGQAVRAQWPGVPASKRAEIVAVIVERLPLLVLALVVHTVATLALFGHAVTQRRPFWALGNLLVLLVPPIYALFKLETGAFNKVLLVVGWATGPAAGFGLQFAIARILI